MKRSPRYAKDLSTRGRPYKVIAISLPVDELATLDAFADRQLMARSHAIREAVRRLVEESRTTAEPAADQAA